MKKILFGLLIFGCGISYAAVTYVKNVDGNAVRHEVLSSEKLASSLDGLKQEEIHLASENATMQGYVDKWQAKIDANNVRLVEVQSEIAEIEAVK